MYLLFFFFFTALPTSQLCALSLRDALPIYRDRILRAAVRLLLLRVADDLQSAEHADDGVRGRAGPERERPDDPAALPQDRKSTRLNSSHLVISYAVFCLKKQKKQFIM